MNILQVAILSIVEGITEFLPVSSTGHLILTADILDIAPTSFVKSFEIIIQLGAICAILSLYFRMLLKNMRLLVLLFLGFLPSAIVGFFLYDIIKAYFLESSFITCVALFLGGVVLILLERRGIEKESVKNIHHLTLFQAICIGVGQSVSLIPGVSRAGATIVSGLLVGLNRKEAVVFSFLLALPTMAAATGLDLLKSEFRFSQNELFLLIVGMVFSFLTALFTIRFLLRFIENHTFIPFGIYRIVLSVVFLLYIFLR